MLLVIKTAREKERERKLLLWLALQAIHSTPMKRTAASPTDALAVGSTEPCYDRADQQRIGDKFFDGDDRPVILFDGVCNFCNGWVNFVLDNDKKG